jgi:quercetin dioxygenase-like cupin family protein
VTAAFEHVVHPDDVEPRMNDGAETRTTFDARNGCDLLEQRLLRFAPGTSPQRSSGQGQEVLYVVSGAGELELGGARYKLEPATGVFVPAGTEYAVEATEELILLSVVTPTETHDIPPERKVTVRYADQPELEASSERSFRYLVNEDAGCADVTQFLGIVQPSKAPFHSHPYDEVGYVIKGQGIAHVDGEEVPLRAGSCFHLAPGQVHCIENSGPGEMRILGVFHPSGSPADRAYPTTSSAKLR